MKFRRILAAALIAFAMLAGVLWVSRTQKSAVAADLEQENLPEIEVEPELLDQIQSAASPGYLIYFRQRPDLSSAYGMDWEARGRFVAAALQKSAESTQRRVRAYLDSQGVRYKSFWIDNLIVVEGGSSPAAFNGLFDFLEISALRARRQPLLYEPEYQELSPNSVTALTANLSHIKADQVWALGYTGQGIVVANIDTGVLYTHESLVNQYRGSLGGGLFDHNYNWWDPIYGGSDLFPTANYTLYNGHGTNTMGIMVGDEIGNYQTGMAPGAQWIACQAFESIEADQDDELLECTQFMLAPTDLNGENADPDLRPHIVNNSWGDCEQTLDSWYKGVVTSWLAAGIYPVFSNGNASNCGYATPPGLNTVGNPARYGEVTGVGSTGTSNSAYASHANWGPTDDPDTVNPNGIPDLKPQVVAPGVLIITTSGAGDTNYALQTGTSAAAPHVAGLVALMWDAAPCLIGNYSTTETILQQTANPILYDDGTGGGAHSPNYATGWGEIDALAAVQAAVEWCTLDVTPEIENICNPNPALFDINLRGGFSDTATLSVQNLPTGIFYAFGSNPVLPIDETVLTIGITTTATTGMYNIDVVGESPTQKFTDTITLDAFAGTFFSPELIAPEDGATDVSELPVLTWYAVDGASSYLAEIALDENFIGVIYSATTSINYHDVVKWLDHGSQYFWRVTAENPCGARISSPTFDFMVKPSNSILLVDDDNDWPDVGSTYSQTLTSLGFAYDTWNTYGSDKEPDAMQLADYETVIWFTGAADGPYTGPSSTSEANMQSWLNEGKCLLISSQEYYANRGLAGFMTAILGVDSISNNAGFTVITGTGSIFEALGPYMLNYPFSNESDRITPDGTAAVAFSSDMGGAAITKDNGTYKTTYFGFPFEALPTSSARMDVMNTFLSWCGFERIFFPIIYR